VNRVGRRKALRMLLLGESVHGDEEAEQLDYADYVADEGESSFDAAMRLVVEPILKLPCSQSVRAIKRVVSVVDGDEDIIDTASGKLRYTKDIINKYNNATAAKSEIDEFLQVWGGESNKDLIKKTRESLKNKTR
jgi:enoyl-CoA hydratase/carnithine racemase